VIILDTNLVSEPMRRAPDQCVLNWIDAQTLNTLYLTAISTAELRAGVALLPSGKRRDSLHYDLENTVLPHFTDRILAFDLACTPAYAKVLARSRKTGRAIGKADAFIAAIVLTHDYAVATRDTKPFQAAGVRVINPWKY
jgi:predicted nucleic acid-binding protein